jgi:hypothetical protein
MRIVKVQLAVILILVGVYCLQIATPLRLNTDTVILLSVAETAEHGGGFLYHGQTTIFPPGYPTLVAMLIRLHVAHVWVIIGINILFLVIGLLAIRNLFRSEGVAEIFTLGVCILSALSFVYIKYSAIPLTDSVFFGVSMCCLAYMKPAASCTTWRRVIGSVVLVLLAICIRRIGIALIPAWLYMVVFKSDGRLLIKRFPGLKVTTVSVAAIVGVAIALVVRKTSSLTDFHAVLNGNPFVDSMLRIFGFRLRELGEIAVNLPFPALPRMVQDVLPVVGALVFSLIMFGMFLRRKRFGEIEAYFLSYMAILMVWPYYDPRFWLPVIPLVMWYLALAVDLPTQNKTAARLSECYVMIFAVLGVFSIASNTALSFSGSAFADLFAGSYHSTNCAVWRCKAADLAAVDVDGLHLLRYYKQH